MEREKENVHEHFYFHFNSTQDNSVRSQLYQRTSSFPSFSIFHPRRFSINSINSIDSIDSINRLPSYLQLRALPKSLLVHRLPSWTHAP